MAKWPDITAEVANIAAQRDAAEKRAEVAEERLRAVEASRDAWIKVAEVLRERLDAAEAELARIRAADTTKAAGGERNADR